MPYTLRKLDLNLLKAASEQWSNELEELGEDNVPPRGYFIYLGYIENELTTNKHPNIHHYALCENDNIEAIFQMSVALPNLPDGWLKVLSVRSYCQIWCSTC